jgi:hypothetical protein
MKHSLLLLAALPLAQFVVKAAYINLLDERGLAVSSEFLHLP